MFSTTLDNIFNLKLKMIKRKTSKNKDNKIILNENSN